MHKARETAASAQTVEALSDQAIERILRVAFAPHRCDVKLQIDVFVGSKKVAVIIYASRPGSSAEERSFIVEGVNVEALRRRDTLLSYIDDVRKELQRRHIALAARPPLLATLGVSRVATAAPKTAGQGQACYWASGVRKAGRSVNKDAPGSSHP